MKKRVMGVISVAERDELLQELTLKRSIASVPFGGRYRLIDFILSSMVNSGIQNIAVFPSGKYRSLMDHLGTGKDWDLNRKRGGLFILPPNSVTAAQSPDGGELHNLSRHLDYFYKSPEDYVLISGGNIICNMDFSPVFHFYQDVRADITILFKEIKKPEEGNGFAHCRRIEVGEDGRVTGMERAPGGVAGGKVLLKLFFLKKALLLNIMEDSRSKNGGDLFEDGMIKNLGKLRIFAFPAQGCMAVINSVEIYYEQNMNLLNPLLYKELFFRPGLIYTKAKDEPPTKYLKEARVTNSLLANGCLIDGTVENSILFRGVKVQKEACVRNSIIMQRCEIGEGSRVEYAILDKEVLVSRGREVVGERGTPVVIPKKKKI